MNSRLSSASACAALLSALVVGACTSAQEDVGSAEADQVCNPCVVDPNGSDKPGQLLVTLPAAPATNDGFSINSDTSTPLTINQAKELPSGKHCLELIDNNRSGSSRDCSIVITSNPTVTVDLGIVQYKQSGTPTLGLDFPTVTNSIIAGAPAFTASRHPDSLKTVAARLPGAYHYQFGLFDGVDQTLPGGSTQTLDFQASSSLKQRRLAKITSPTRNFPGSCRNGASPTYDLSASGPSGNASTGALRVQPDFGFIVGDFASPKGGSKVVFRIDSNNALSMELPLAAPGAAPAELAVSRIEVNDVAVTKNDGTVVRVPGQFMVEKATTVSGVETFQNICGSMATKSGLDVVPGKYRITTTYSTVEAGQKTDVQVITAD